ncbi:flavin reductase [Notoacmeibacter sp. MSK16QG-6]|uniref:flavin reductase n=1 Tax=Notoacmeibacter sp. MSK16QG-6 TaxID=2957982 RepID=UPI0020A18A2D|nr:flavin reductase [Notoacmeibacter sp. MSK16QG-6]MCP1199440.1 flavin reductase [Notoacmeibacter sp. MSK16QG-6]
MLVSRDVDPQSYRDAMARFAGAVHIVTTDGDAGRRGVTIIAGCSVSDDPPTVLVCLNRHNPSNELFVQNGRFALNTLPDGKTDIADAFAGFTGEEQEDRFARAEWTVLQSGSPVLTEAASVFDCEIEHVHDHATHRVLFGRVTALAIGPSLTPLIYYDRNYRQLAPEEEQSMAVPGRETA